MRISGSIHPTTGGAHVAVQPMETTVALQQPALAVNQKNGLSSQAQSATDEMVAAAPAEAPERYRAPSTL